MYCVKTGHTAPRIGEAVMNQIKETQKNFPHDTIKVVAVVPRMLSYYTIMPERYEVTEADVIVEVG